MKPWNIKRVEQKGPTCVIACMAMILGVDFDSVEKHFEFPEQGTLNKIADYVSDHGYAVMIKELMFYSHPRFAREEITKPFAPAHVLQAATGVVALRHRRRYIGIELSEEYVNLSHERLSDVQIGLF